MKTQEEAPSRQSEKTYRPVSEEELLELAKELFGDSEKWCEGLHPSVQRLVLKAINEDLYNRKEQVAEYEKMLDEAGLTKEEVEFKPKAYNVGGYEIKFNK